MERYIVNIQFKTIGQLKTVKLDPLDLYSFLAMYQRHTFLQLLNLLSKNIFLKSNHFYSACMHCHSFPVTKIMTMEQYMSCEV